MPGSLRCLSLVLLATLCGCAHSLKHVDPVVVGGIDMPESAVTVSTPAAAPTALRAESFLGSAAQQMDEQAREDFLSAQQAAL